MPTAIPLSKPRAGIRRIGRNKPFTGIPASPPPQSIPAPAVTTTTVATNRCCEDPKHETHDGYLVCTNCGTQISENNIVAEVTFGESSTGRAEVQGGYIGSEARHANTLGGQANRRLGGSTRDTREETKENGRNELRQMCVQLGIPTPIEATANTIWGLASANNFIQGRRTNEVAAACLYASCRREESNTIMLIDIAEAQSVNVFKLGDIYKEMTKALFLRENHQVKALMEIEPLLMKYCKRLEFGDKVREVAADAARIMRRMNRDWMITGRHPAGLCGACIILAARMNNFRRTVREVVYIVKVSNITINSRLQEFKNTRSSTMTVQAFRDKGLQLKHAHDPPSVHAADKRQNRIENRMKKRMARLEQRSSETGSPVGSSVSRESSQAASGAGDDETTTPSAEVATPPPSATVPAKRKRNSTRANDQMVREQNLSLPSPQPSQVQQTPSQPEETPSQSPPVQGPRRDADGFVIPALPASQTQPDAASEPPKKRGRKPAPVIEFTEADFASEQELEYDIKSILQDSACVSARDDAEREKLDSHAAQIAEQQRAAATRATTTRLAAQGRPLSAISDSETILPEEFDDDPEVANALLDEAAVRVKEAIWLRDNEDWLRAQQAKALRQELEKAEGRSDKKKKTRKRSRLGDGSVLAGTPVMSPGDAAARMLNKRATTGFSKNIDYEALNRIYDGVKGKEEGPRSTREGSAESETASEISSVASRSRASSVASAVPGRVQPGGASSAAAKKRQQIGEASWVEEKQEDVIAGKVTGKRAEKAALKRVKEASEEATEVAPKRNRTGSAGADVVSSEHAASQQSVERAPGDEVVATTEPGPGGAKASPIEIADNVEDEEEEDDDDDDEEEEAYDSDENTWAPSPGNDDYGDDEINDDAFMRDYEGNEDAYAD